MHTNDNVAYVYRVWRDKRIEELLVKLWKRAFANASILQKIVHEEPEYVAVRAQFQAMADEWPVEQVIRMTPATEKIFLDMEAHQESLLAVDHGPAAPEMEHEQVLLKEANERMLAINKTDYKKHRPEFIKLLSDQIGVCAQIIGLLQ